MSAVVIFRGCVVSNRYPGVEYAINQLLSKCRLESLEVTTFSCCPVPFLTYNLNRETWLALAARNLSIVQEKRCELLTICNGCYASLRRATEVLSSQDNAVRVNKILANIGRKYRSDPGPPPVKHLIEILYNCLGSDYLKRNLCRPMENLRVAVQYGCRYLRPMKNVTLEDPERPTKIDELVEATGATTVDYDDKLTCCGSGGGVRVQEDELANSISMLKVKNVREAGANIIVTPCPHCMIKLEETQTRSLEKGIPVLHVAELIALALGADVEPLEFKKHLIEVEPVLRGCGVIT